MRPTYIARRRVFTAALAAALFFVWGTASASAQKCDQAPIKYSHEKYVIGEVRIESLFDFLHATSSYLNDVKAKLPLKAGDKFRVAKWSGGRRIIEEELKKIEDAADPRTGLRVILPQLNNCHTDASGKGVLDIVYRIFTTNYDSYLSHTWELKDKEVERPATSDLDRTTRGFLTAKPLGGYNHTRRVFGGGQVQLALPVASLERVQLFGVGSSTSNNEDFDVAGGFAPAKKLLNQLDYSLIYKHSDVPSIDNRLRQGLIVFQAFGASKPLGSKEVILRYGVSMHGGNQQTDTTLLGLANTSIADSGNGGLKAYVGGTMNRSNVSIAASYGIQLGTLGASTDIEFIKHLADVSLTARFLRSAGKPGEVHKALTLEARLAGGMIQRQGRIPVAERFFGGNIKHNFFEDDTWQILSNPFIRSIPENHLSSTALTTDVGGTRFYSANFTVGREIWGHPLLPKEIAADEDFPDALNASVETTRRLLRNIYLGDVPGYVTFAKAMPQSTVAGSAVPLRQVLSNLNDNLKGVIESVPDTFDQKVDMSDEVDAATSEIVTILALFDEDKNQKEVAKDLPSTLTQILIEKDSEHCFESMKNNGCSSFTTIRLMMKMFADHLDAATMSADAKALRDTESELKLRQTALAKDLNAIDTSKADELTAIDMKAIEVPLNAFLNELNLIAISPVGVFDVARITPDRFGTRVGAGAGARLTVLNFNLTFGYAFNLRHRSVDGPGALFFSVDFLDIFR